MIHYEIPADGVKITVIIGHKEPTTDLLGIATLTAYAKPHAHTGDVIQVTLKLLNLDEIDRLFLDYAITLNDMTLPHIMWESTATITATVEMLKEG